MVVPGPHEYDDRQFPPVTAGQRWQSEPAGMQQPGHLMLLPSPVTQYSSH